MFNLISRVILLALLLGGCASVPEKPQALIDSFSAIAIVTAATTPEVNLDTFAKDSWSGGGKGFLADTGARY